MSSTAEAELGALFINAKTAVSMQQTLIELGQPQPRTLMQTNNATAHTLLTNKNLTQSTQGHGHAFSLATVPQRPRTIPLYLETWHTELGRLLHQASPRNTPQVCTPNNPHSSQQSRIQETIQATVGPTTRPTTKLPPLALPPENRRIRKIGRERKRTNNKNHRNINQNVCRYKILRQNSLTVTTVPRHAAKHDHSKRCLRILRQGCVRPTIRYVPIGRKGSLNKQFPPRAQNSLRNTKSQGILSPIGNQKQETRWRWYYEQPPTLFPGWQ
jgi:hypothetical protein